MHKIFTFSPPPALKKCELQMTRTSEKGSVAQGEKKSLCLLPRVHKRKTKFSSGGVNFEAATLLRWYLANHSLFYT